MPESDYFPLLAVMLGTGMTSRAVATALEVCMGRDYIEGLYNTAHELPNRDVPESEIERVRAPLRPHGYEEWAAED